MRVTLGSPISGDGRSRRRFAAMRRVQEEALTLFERRGYDEVTIEEIAAAADVGPATIYRNFGTKERIVLWDDYEPALFDLLAQRLPGKVLDVVCEALVEALGPIYAQDSERILRRARLVFGVPAIAAAAAADLVAMRTAFAALFVERKAARAGLAADVLAGAVVATLDAAISHWVRSDGSPALGTFVRRAFRELAAA